MIERKSHRTKWKLIPTVAFVVYALFCLVSQTAYCPVRRGDGHLFTRMEGTHAIAFGVSMLLIAACIGPNGELPGWGNRRGFWFLRGIGFAVAIGLGWYALLGGKPVALL